MDNVRRAHGIGIFALNYIIMTAMAVDINDLGTFSSINAVWKAHPEGGHEGDYLTIGSVKYRWNKYLRIWENASTVTPTPARLVTTVGGDLTVNNDTIIGDELKVRGDTYLEGDVKVEGTIDAKAVKQPNRGFYQSEEALNAAYPKPEVGWWATVGDVMPGTVYRCQTEGVWTNTGRSGGVDTERVFFEIEDSLDSVSTDKALSANQGKQLKMMIDSLKLSGYMFAGVATPESSIETPDEKVFYITPAGAYDSFGSSHTVPAGSIGVFAYNGSWSNVNIPIVNIINNLSSDDIDKALSAAQGKKLYDMQVNAENNIAELRDNTASFDTDETNKLTLISQGVRILADGNIASTGDMNAYLLPIASQSFLNCYVRLYVQSSASYMIGFYNDVNTFDSVTFLGGAYWYSGTKASWVTIKAYVPEGTKAALILSRDANINVVSKEITNALSVLKYEEDKIKELSLPDIGNFVYDYSTFTQNGYLNTSGKIAGISSGYKTTDFISTKDVISIGFDKLFSASGICLYADNNEESFIYSAMVSGGSISMSDFPNAKYFRGSTNNQAATITIKRTVFVPIKTVVQGLSNYHKNTIIVDASGNGDYTTISEAIANAGDYATHKTIIVKPGIYDELPRTPDSQPYAQAYHNLSIIGVDKNACIVRNKVGFYNNQTPSGVYDYAPLRLSGNVYIANLTILSTSEDYDAEYSQHQSDWSSSYNTNQTSYCVHCDFDAREGDVFEMHNCVLFNDHASCIGAGNRKNYTIRLTDCMIHSVMSVKNSGASWQAPIYVHPKDGTGSTIVVEGQRVELIGNLSKNEGDSLLYIPSNAATPQTLLAVNNVFVANTTSKNVNETLMDEMNFGNNINLLE